MTDPKSTVVISIFPGDGKDLRWMLDAGVAVIYVEGDTSGAKYTPHDPANQTLLYLHPKQTGEDMGHELCRRLGHVTQRQKVIQMQGFEHEPIIPTFVEGMNQMCPHVALDIFTLEGSSRNRYYGIEDTRHLMETVFLVHPDVAVVLTLHDLHADAVIRAADEMLPPAIAQRILVSGYEHSDVGRAHMARGRLFATVDQLMFTANEGVWYSAAKVVSLIGRDNLSSSIAVFERLGMNTTTIDNFEVYALPAPTMMVPADGAGFVTSEVFANYQQSVRPQNGGHTFVTVGLENFVASAIDFGKDSVEATFTLLVSWEDHRLQWNSLVYNGTLERDAGDVWTPGVRLENMMPSDQESHQSRVNINHDRKIWFIRKVSGLFACDLSTVARPYESHTCSIGVTAGSSASEVRMRDGFGAEFISGPGGYAIKPGGTEGRVNRYGPRGDVAIHAMYFHFSLEQQPGYAMTSYVMVSWALSMVSFAQFWIPLEHGNLDRSGIAITSILSSIALQSEAKQTKDSTWLDIYFIVCQFFQFVSFGVTVLASLTNRHLQLKSGGRNTIMLEHYSKVYPWWCSVWFAAFGGTHDFFVDRWARRLIVPAFDLIVMFLPFHPLIRSHGNSGSLSPLFWLGACKVSIYVVILVVGVPFWRSWQRQNASNKKFDDENADANLDL